MLCRLLRQRQRCPQTRKRNDYAAQFSQADGNMNDGGQFGEVTSLRYQSERVLQLSIRITF